MGARVPERARLGRKRRTRRSQSACHESDDSDDSEELDPMVFESSEQPSSEKPKVSLLELIARALWAASYTMVFAKEMAFNYGRLGRAREEELHYASSSYRRRLKGDTAAEMEWLHAKRVRVMSTDSSCTHGSAVCGARTARASSRDALCEAPCVLLSQCGAVAFRRAVPRR